MMQDPTTNDRSGDRFEALLASLEPVRAPRMPNAAWLAFITGPLSPEDWQLIGRVECGEITVDQAMQSHAA